MWDRGYADRCFARVPPSDPSGGAVAGSDSPAPVAPLQRLGRRGSGADYRPAHGGHRACWLGGDKVRESRLFVARNPELFPALSPSAEGFDRCFARVPQLTPSGYCPLSLRGLAPHLAPLRYGSGGQRSLMGRLTCPPHPFHASSARARRGADCQLFVARNPELFPAPRSSAEGFDRLSGTRAATPPPRRVASPPPQPRTG